MTPDGDGDIAESLVLAQVEDLEAGVAAGPSFDGGLPAPDADGDVASFEVADSDGSFTMRVAATYGGFSVQMLLPERY